MLNKAYKKCVVFLITIIFAIVTTSCGTGKQVVIYTSVDQIYAEPILRQFELETSMKVLAVYDTEASKTTGMVNRLIEEKKRPQADVFWNGEFMQTLSLQGENVLDSYISKNAESIPAKFKDANGYWTAFGGRARVFLVNTQLVQENDYPTGIADLFNEKFEPYSIGLAMPIFGTTATHAAALYALNGHDDAKAYYQAVADRGIRIVDGNSVVRDMVADGVLAYGLTDTDDALGAIRKGSPVKMIVPDQGENGIGTLLVPNTVALIKGAPHKESAKLFIDWILREETEKRLVEIDWCQTTVRPIQELSTIEELQNIKTMDVNFINVRSSMEASKQDLTEMFVK